MQLRYSILPIFMYSHMHSLLPFEYYYNYMSICKNIWTKILCNYLKSFHTPLERSEMPLKVQRPLKFEFGRTNVRNNVRHGARKKEAINEVFKDVRMMSVVSDKQKQAGSSGSAPATPQGNNLPPVVPPPSISRNPLRGSKCNNLHFIPVPPLPYPLTLSLEYNPYSIERLHKLCRNISLHHCKNFGKCCYNVAATVKCLFLEIF